MASTYEPYVYKPYTFDLTDPKLSYMLGFMQADGSLRANTRNRGMMAIEISKKDEHILYEFKELVTCNSYLRERTRDTNFKSGHTSTTWSVHDWGFRDAINEAGVPYGSKSKVIEPPKKPFSISDYWRGIIDADGSLGITGQGFPFCSLVTTSTPLAEAYFDLIENLVGYRPTTKRNNRDDAYNIMVNNENAQTLVRFLYGNATICLDRKRLSAERVLQWIRIEKPRTKTIRWSIEEDNYMLSHTVSETALFTGRDHSSIYTRRARLLRKSRKR